MAEHRPTPIDSDREYLKRVITPEPLPPLAEKRLFAQVAAGDQAAKQTLTNHNMRLVADTIRKIPQRNQMGAVKPGGLEFSDLMNEGAIALGNAIEKFNPRFGVPFKNYAEAAIKNEIAKALIKKEDLVYMPAKAGQLERLIYKIEEDRKTAGETRSLTDRELADMTGETETMVANVRAAPRVVTSLQAPTASGGELGDQLADTTADPSIEEDASVLDHFTPERVNELLNAIKPRYADPIRKHFLESKTLETTAQETGVSTTTAAKNIRHGFGQLRRVANAQINESQATAALQAVASKGALPQ